jgi:hypothetical protein
VDLCLFFVSGGFDHEVREDVCSDCGCVGCYLQRVVGLRPPSLPSMLQLLLFLLDLQQRLLLEVVPR